MLEIKELIIKVTVYDEAGGSTGRLPQPGLPTGDELQRWQRELTRTCVQQVLAELQRRADR
jgi:hypothetical protein